MGRNRKKVTRSKRGAAFAKWIHKVNPTLDQTGIHEAFNAGWDACKEEQASKAYAQTSASLKDVRGPGF